MFGLVNNKDYSELGGEIHQDRKKRERTALIIFSAIAIGLLNLVLYLLTIS